MTGREKLELTMTHRSGPVPLDFGATVVTGIHCSIVEKLREHYGLPKRPVMVCEPFQMLGLIEDDLKAAIGVDTDAILSDSTMFGFPPGGEKEWTAPWGQAVLVSEDFNTKTTLNGDVYIYPCGDTACQPCAHMPANGYFFDSIIRGNTYDEDHPNQSRSRRKRNFSQLRMSWHSYPLLRQILTGGPCASFSAQGCGLRNCAGYAGAILINRRFM